VKAEMKTSNLGEIIAEPSRIGELSPEAVAELRGELARLDSLLLARLMTINGSVQGEQATPTDRRLNVKQAALKIGLTPDYLYRHSRNLPFTIRVGRTVGFSEQGIERWLRQRAGG
jgi:predicted DNA-binding transcriptional regulator AlpA